MSGLDYSFAKDPDVYVELSSGGFACYLPTTATMRFECEADGSEDWGPYEEEVSSLSDICMSATYPNSTHICSVSVGGMILAQAGQRFRCGADDNGTVSVGEAVSTVSGTTGFRWGNYAFVTQTGLVSASASFDSIGGPYDFRIEGIDGTFYADAGTLPFASLTVSPSAITVPWEGDAPTGHYSLSDSALKDFCEITSEDGLLSVNNDGSFTVNKSAFLGMNVEETNAVLTLVQTCGGKARRVQVGVALRREPVSLEFGEVSMSNGDLGTTEGIPSTRALNFAICNFDVTGIIAQTGDVEVEGLQSFVDSFGGKAVSTNVIVVATWKATGFGATITQSSPINVAVELTAKCDDECPCTTCAEGSDVKSGCISFSQAFGRTPYHEGLPVGALRIREESWSDLLLTPKVLKYDHPMMRKLDTRLRKVTSPIGRPVRYLSSGFPADANAAANTRLIYREDGCWRALFPDRSEVVYDPSGSVTGLVSRLGVYMPVEELGIRITFDESGAISRLDSDADGSLVVTNITSIGYAVDKYDASGVFVKRFAFSQEGSRGLRLEDSCYPTLWAWDEAANDFVMVKGEGTEASTTRRQVSYDGAFIDVSMEVSDSTGNLASREGERIASHLGNKVVGRTQGARTTYSAERVADNDDGRGRTASTVDASGCTENFVYDPQGRTLVATRSGVVAHETRYTYSADPFDQRPIRVETRQNGILTMIEEFSDTVDENGYRHEVRTRNGRITETVFNPVYDYTDFGAGKVCLRLTHDGHARSFAYDGFSRTVTETEGLWADDGFMEIDGRSTRIRTTYDVSGNASQIVREAYVSGSWRELGWESRTYNHAHKHIGSTYSDGRTRDSRWNCTGPLWERDESGVATTNVYDSLKRLVSSTRYSPLGTLTTTYTYDAAGRVVATNRGGLVSTRTYDDSGRTIEECDESGIVTRYAYSDDNLITTITYSDGGTRVTTRNADGSLASITGTAVTPEYYTYGITADGLEWTSIRYGRIDSSRFEKTYRNGFGETVRVERSGYNGAMLVTENTYNEKGRLVQTIETGKPTITYVYDDWGDLISTTQSAGSVSRTTESENAYVLLDGEVWHGSAQAISTSDSTIAPLVTESYSKVSRLSLDRIAESFTVDVRGNTNRTWSAVDPSTAKRMSWSTRAGVGNTAFLESIDGATIRTVDTSAITNTVQYDAFKRQVATTDGRSNTTSYVYDELGRMSRQIDPCGNETAYVYDAMGRISEVTNALGNVTFTRYDLRGNKTYEGGATYPVSYTYDEFGNRTSMTTYRNEVSSEGDTTSWIYDEATGLVTQKLYADGHGPSYTYTPDGKLATRTWARGIVTNYGYDMWGNLTSTTYSDGTPSVTLSYDALGRKSSVSDAAGVTRFSYDSYGNLASERWGGLGNRVLTRHYDAYGRNVGYSVNGARKTTIGYDSSTGRIATMNEGGNFAWQYLAGSHLKSRVSYPNGITVDYSYELNRDLLTEVRNYRGSIEYSRYLYANDALGRRTARNGEEYGYNNRNELTSAVGNGSYQYSYDDIGNRERSIEPTQTYEYEANELNQYTQIAEAGIDTEVPFGPVYDEDGNQTLVKTSTGIWHVEYNGENRPIRWTRANTVITMDFDSMGRRTFYREMENGRQVTFTRFFYDGYLLIQQLFSNAPYNVYKEFIWDPTEQIATKPLCFRQNGQVSTFLTHDGNKNVTDVIRVGPYNDFIGHYDYAPFGAVRSQTGARAAANPFRFSSEFSDDTLGLVYYNYRHYEPKMGRWLSRDPIGVRGGLSLYGVCRNDFCNLFDRLGRDVWTENTTAVGGWHRRVCVDEWKRDPSGACCFDKKRYSKTGKRYCISFGAKNKDADVWDSISGDGGSSDSDSSGDSSVSGDESLGETVGEAKFPSGFDGPNSDGDGAVYEDMKDKKTEEKQRMTSGCACDIPFKRYMQSLVKKSANYALFTQSCRNFSDAMFGEAEVRCAGKE